MVIHVLGNISVIFFWSEYLTSTTLQIKMCVALPAATDAGKKWENNSKQKSSTLAKRYRATYCAFRLFIFLPHEPRCWTPPEVSPAGTDFKYEIGRFHRFRCSTEHPMLRPSWCRAWKTINTANEQIKIFSRQQHLPSYYPAARRDGSECPGRCRLVASP